MLYRDVLRHFQHPLRPDQHIRILHGLPGLPGETFLPARTHADKCDLPWVPETIFLRKHEKDFLQGKPSLLGSADDHGNGSGLSGRLHLLLKTADLAGVLCHQIARFHVGQKLLVHALRKRPLHGNEVLSLKSFLHRVLHRLFCGEHPQETSPPVIRDLGVGIQLFAARGDQDIALLVRQVGSGLPDILHPHGILAAGGSFPQYPHTGNVRLLTHGPDVLGHLHGKRVGGVNDKLRLASSCQLAHACHIQPAGQDMDVFPILHKFFAILSGRTHIHLRRMPPEVFRDLSPLSRTCKN